MNRKLLLRVNAVFLILMGAMAAIMDLLSYFWAKGAFGDTLYGNPLAIGPFEAHVLAVILGLLIFRYSSSPDSRFWHLVGAAIALNLGVANLIWFEMFHRANAVPMGIAVTLIHGLLFGAQLLAYSGARERLS